MVGISVRERKYDAIIAKTTAIASGVNRYLAVPVNSSTGTKTMQMERVATNGAAICAPSSTARPGLSHGDVAVRVFDRDCASSTRMPTASARPPRVMMLMVWPRRIRAKGEVRIERGMGRRR